MLLIGIILIILASMFLGFAGLTNRRMSERGPDITWELLPLNSIKCKFVDKLESILIATTIISYIICIVGSILIGKETNLWIGIISFIIGASLNKFLWQPILSRIDLIDFWDDSSKVSKEPRQEVINALVEQSSMEIGGKTVKPGTLDGRVDEFSSETLNQFLDKYGDPYQRREFENFANRVEMAKTGYFGGRQRTEDFIVQGLVAERILRDLDAVTNALKSRQDHGIRPENPLYGR